MTILTFTDEEIRQIAEQSQIFATKLQALSKNPNEAPKLGNSTASANLDAVKEFFDTKCKNKSMTSCVNLIRTWAKENGIQKYSSLAGAQRIAQELITEAKEKAENE